MLKKLIRFSLDNATLVLVLAGVLLVFAGYQVSRTPVDVFPELSDDIEIDQARTQLVEMKLPVVLHLVYALQTKNFFLCCEIFYSFRYAPQA